MIALVLKQVTQIVLTGSFQAMFVCATVSIVSGAVAERIKIWPFFIFATFMGGFIYPISMGWQWGGGWLATSGFQILLDQLLFMHVVGLLP